MKENIQGSTSDSAESIMIGSSGAPSSTPAAAAVSGGESKLPPAPGDPGAVLTSCKLISKGQHCYPTSRIYGLKRSKQIDELTHKPALKE